MAKYDVGYVKYINQAAEPFANIEMKNGEKVSSVGCAVCAYAMLICHKEGYDSDEDAVQVVKDIIKQCTNDNALMTTTFSNKTINGKKYSAVEVSDMAAEIHEGVPVVARLEKNGSACHFVTVVGTDTSQSGMDVYQIKDPGKSKNTTLQQAMNNYSGCKLKGKFIIE